MSLVKNFQQLVQIPSLSGKEREVQNYIKAQFDSLHLNPIFQDGNLILYLEGINQKKAFIFNSHVDVVHPGDETRWTHGGPWSGAIENGKLFGRGASDMKGGVAASMEVAKRMAEAGKPPTDVYFTYVVQEETDGTGTRAFADWFQKDGRMGKYREVAAVFTEPTLLTSLEHGHRGNYFIKAEFAGDAGHASRPQNIKRHAIITMIDFIDDLKKKSKEWSKRFPTDEFMAPTITPTAIQASTESPNKVSDFCRATFDLRTIPLWNEQAYAEVIALAQPRGITISLICPNSPTGYTRKDAKIIKAFQQAVPGIQVTVSQAAADLGFLSKIGIDGVIFGPGDMKNAHVINESIEIDQVERAPDMYQRAYEAWAQY